MIDRYRLRREGSGVDTEAAALFVIVHFCITYLNACIYHVQMKAERIGRRLISDRHAPRAIRSWAERLGGRFVKQV